MLSRSMENSSRVRAGSASTIGSGYMTAALFTSANNQGCRRPTSSTSSASTPSLAMSRAIQWLPGPPAIRILSAVFSSSADDRPTSQHSIPAFPSRRAVARPSPLDAPVMMAARPLNSVLIISHLIRKGWSAAKYWRTEFSILPDWAEFHARTGMPGLSTALWQMAHPQQRGTCCESIQHRNSTSHV
jgi:hypothetical protein